MVRLSSHEGRKDFFSCVSLRTFIAQDIHRLGHTSIEFSCNWDFCWAQDISRRKLGPFAAPMQLNLPWCAWRDQRALPSYQLTDGIYPQTPLYWTAIAVGCQQFDCSCSVTPLPQICSFSTKMIHTNPNRFPKCSGSLVTNQVVIMQPITTD